MLLHSVKYIKYPITSIVLPGEFELHRFLIELEIETLIPFRLRITLLQPLQYIAVQYILAKLIIVLEQLAFL